MSIKARILALVAAFAVMALGIAGLGVLTIRDYDRMMKNYGLSYDNTYYGEHLNYLVSSAVMESRGIYLSRDTNAARIFAKRLENDLTEIEQTMEDWRAIGGPAKLASFGVIEKQAQEFITFRRELIRLGTTVSPAEADKLGNNERARARRIAFQADVEKAVMASRKDLANHQAIAQEYHAKRAIHFLTVAILGIVLMVAISIWIVVEFISKPLKTIANAIISVSEGKYETPIPDAHPHHDPGHVHHQHDEIAAVWRAIEHLRDRAIEADRLAKEQREIERLKQMELRQIILD